VTASHSGHYVDIPDFLPVFIGDFLAAENADTRVRAEEIDGAVFALGALYERA